MQKNADVGWDNGRKEGLEVYLAFRAGRAGKLHLLSKSNGWTSFLGPLVGGLETTPGKEWGELVKQIKRGKR